ncbi:MAG: sugar phosphate isomerase/epimerase, partial [Microlunatus sp.]|nr:sugar phosphate isomerase/epimerase [Microlunatus sp.]
MLTAETPRPAALTDTRLSRLSLNQRTIAGWTLREAIDGCLSTGLPAIGVWREQVAEAGSDTAVRWLAEAGLRVSSLCRGGFFTGADPASIEAAHAENLRAVDEAAALGAATLCLVPGGLPAGDRDLPGARGRVAEAIDRLVPYARDRGVGLGLEPMNPIYAADRGVVSTLGQALDIAEAYAPSEVGVVLDTFHVWWDPDLATQIARAA